MKRLLTIGLFQISILIAVFSQNRNAEIAYMKAQFDKGIIDQKSFINKTKTFDAIISELGEYPAIPFDNTKKEYRYEFVSNVPGISKNIIYNRILEFMSLRYNHLDEVLDYQDYDLGKVIIKERYSLGDAKGGFQIYYLATERFTILENKYKLEVTNVSVDFFYESYDKDDIVVYNYNSPIKTFYPLTQKNHEQLKENILIVHDVNKNIKNLSNEIPIFIKNYKSDYNF